VHRLPPHLSNYRTNDFTRLYAKIVSATPMNTTPHATMSPFTLVIVVVVDATARLRRQRVRAPRRRSALVTTDAELRLMARAAIMGESSHPVNG
jgi:hypothetical protein